MMPLKDTTPAQRLAIVNLLNILLRRLNCNDNYRVHDDRKDIMIRESTSNPPPARRQRRIQTILTAFKIEVKIGAISITSLLRAHRQIPTMFVQQVDKKLLDVLALATIKNPDGVDEATSSYIPKTVRAHWDDFSSSMQNHLIKCAQANLASLLSKLSDSDIDLTFISPVGLAPPAFPVRLPLTAGAVAIDDPGAAVNQVYDITELLSFKIGADGSRKHPLTSMPFRLGDILPAPDALKLLLEQALEAVAACPTSRPK